RGEAHPWALVEERPERSAWREREPEPPRSLREPERIVDTGMAGPEEEARIGHRRKRPTGALELLRHPRAANGELVANAHDVLAVLAAGEHLVHEPLRERRCGEAGQ